MRTILSLFSLLFLVACTCTSALSQEVPVQDYSRIDLKFEAYSQEVYDGKTDKISNHRTRLRFHLDDKGSPFSSFVELDVSGEDGEMDDLRESNWLHQMKLAYKPGDTKVTVGRIFVPGGLATYWPGGISTARYPGAYPFAAYAYGAEAEKDFGEWNVGTSLSGQSGLKFDDGGQFDRAEVTARAKRPFENGFYALGVQGSDQFVRSGVDFRYNFAEGFISGGVFHDDADDTPFSGLVTAEWNFTDLLSPHIQIEERTSGDEVVTAGVGVRYKGFYLVGDYEYNLDADEDSGNPVVALRYNW